MYVNKYVTFHGGIESVEVPRYRVSFVYSWDFVILQNYHLFLAFSYLPVLNKAIILLMTKIMHKKVGFIMILAKDMFIIVNLVIF